MIPVVAPCKDCEERELGCHDRCEKYQTFREARKEFNRKVAEFNKYDDYVFGRKARIRDNLEKLKRK